MLYCYVRVIWCRLGYYGQEGQGYCQLGDWGYLNGLVGLVFVNMIYKRDDDE